MTDIQLRPANYFAAHYTVIPGETAKVFGTGAAPSATAAAASSGGSKGVNASVSNSAAVGVSELVELRLVCSQHPSHKSPPYTRQERESGPRREVRKFTFCFRHRCGLESDDAFARVCLDAVFPQLKLWLALADKAAKDGAQFHLQAVQEAWVEVEESRSMSASPLTSPLEAAPLTPRSHFQQRRMRRLLGVDDDDDDLIASLNRVSETQVHAFVVLDALMAPLVSLRLAHELKLSQRQPAPQGLGSGDVALAALKAPAKATGEKHAARPSSRKSEGNPLSSTVSQASYLWNTLELHVLLSQLADFARIAGCFTRKGTRRRSGDEPTIMLDIDEDRIFVQLEGASVGEVDRLASVTFSIDTINTCCKLRDNRYVQSPSIVKVQHDFHVSVWRDTRFPTVVPLTGAAAETLQAMPDLPPPPSREELQTSRDEERHSPEPLTGSKTTMFLIGLLMLRYAMREDYDIRSIRLTPGNTKPPFLLDDDGHARHDATIRALMLQLANGDDVNRPGAVQVLEALCRRANGAHSRSGHSGGAVSSTRKAALSSTLLSAAATPKCPRRPDSMPSQTAGGNTTARRHRPLPNLAACASAESKSVTLSSSIPLTTSTSGGGRGIKAKSHLGITSMYGNLDEKSMTDLIATAERQSRRKLPDVSSAKGGNLLSEQAAILRALEETEFERAQRVKIRKQLAASNIFPGDLSAEQHRIPVRANSWIVGEDDGHHQDDCAAAGESSTTPTSAGLPPLYHSPLRPMTRAKGQSPRHHHHHASFGRAHQLGDGPVPPPGSGDSTQRKTAESPANDVVPLSRHTRRSGPPDVVSRMFEL